jgi:leucyl aminopeptidase
VGDPAALDESGVRDAAAAFSGTASWSVRPALDVAVAGRLMCTDNLPSGTALKLGDVLTARGGTTVADTDAEGRLAMVLAAEDRPDAILDIATLTGA